MYVMINNFPDMTPYRLLDSRKRLIATFIFLCTLEEHLPRSHWLKNKRGTKFQRIILKFKIFDTMSRTIRLNFHKHQL